MWSLWSYCKSRYSDNDLRTQTESMPAETRQSLTEKIVLTLDSHQHQQHGGDVEDGGNENVEELLDKIDDELRVANRQLSHLEEKEEFLAIRIRKYQELLKRQDDHLQELQQNMNQEQSEDSAVAEQQHYREQSEKQQNNKVALGKVVDVHLEILKNIKECKRTIATLERKKYDLKNVTKKCREFLVMAEEAEREQQLGIQDNNNHHHHHDDDQEDDHGRVELEPMISAATEEDRRQVVEEKADPSSARTTTDEAVETQSS